MALSGWQVHPDGVQAVLKSVSAGGETIAGALQPVVKAAAGAAAAADGTGPSIIDEALTAFLKASDPGVKLIEERVPAAADALKGATNAIVAGDDEMAERIQADATRVWAPLPRHAGVE